MVDLCFPRNECYLLKAISISCRVYSPFQTVNFSCSISMRTNQNYINVRGKPNQLFLALNNFLTTPPPSCLSPIIHLFHSSSIFLFQPPSQGSLLPTSTERAKERDPSWVWSRTPQSKINPERGVLCISIFCLFSFCHHTIDRSFRFHRSQ